MWIIGGALMVGGFAWGLFLGRTSTEDHAVVDQYKEKNSALESEVASMKDDLANYREEVTNHFKTTAELIEQMTASYRAVYEHLARGSEALCGSDAALGKLTSEPPQRLEEAKRPEAESGKNGEEKEQQDAVGIDPEATQAQQASSSSNPPAKESGDDRLYH